MCNKFYMRNSLPAPFQQKSHFLKFTGHLPYVSSHPQGSVTPPQTPAGTWLRTSVLDKTERDIRDEITGKRKKREKGSQRDLACNKVMMTCKY